MKHLKWLKTSILKATHFHLKEEVKFLCEDCKKKICDICVCSTHKGHNLTLIKLLVQEKYSKLQDLNNDIQKNKIPRVRKTLQAVEQSVKKIKQGIHANIKAAVKQGDYLKELINMSTAETVSELEEIEKKITKQLDQFKADSKAVIKQLEDLMKESTEATKSDNNILIVDVEEYLSVVPIKEPEFVCDYAHVKFVKGPDPESNIKTALGILVNEQQQQAITTRKLVEPVISKLQQPAIPARRLEEPVISKLQQPAIPIRILVEPVISKLLDLPIVPWSIQRTQKGIFWIVGSRSTDPLTRIDTDGSETTLTLDTDIGDICVDPVTDQLYCTPNTNTSIRTVDTQSGKTTKLFRTKTKPFCLNVTNDGHTFIVGTWGKPEVTLYDRNGTILQTATTVENPYHIAVCRSTGRVAIACLDKGVMVMKNKSNRLHHMYTYQTTGTTIKAYDAEFDGAGHLLVPDHTNSTVHIAAADTGNTLKVIKIDRKPVCLTKQNTGEMVLGIQNPKQLLKIKYFG